MRIVIVIHGFPPEYMAGSEVYTLHLAKELKKKHDVFIFHRIENPFLKEYELIEAEFEGIKKYMINIPYLPHYFEGRYINPKVDKIYEQFIDKIKPDIVHFGHLNYLSTNIIEITKRKGYPVIFTLHDFWLYCPRGQLINRRDESLCYDINTNRCIKCLEEYLANDEQAELKVQQRIEHIQRNVVEYVDLFVSPSKFLLNKMVGFGIPKEKMYYLDYGFNYEFFRNYKKKSSNKIRFGYIGRIIPTKGVHLIIDAFNKIKDNNVELRIYGSSSTLDYLKKRTKNKNIIFKGAYKNWEISNVLSEVDVLIVPSIWFENSPLVIHEAALAKIPVITTNLGGMAEYVKNGVNGLTFERNNVEDLLDKIKQFIKKPELIKKLGNNSIEVQSAREHTKRMLTLYDKLLNR